MKFYLQKRWPLFRPLTRNKSLFLGTLKNEVRRFWWWIKKKSSSNNVWTHKTSIERINKSKTLIKITFFSPKCFIRILDEHMNGQKFLFSLKKNFCMVTSSIGKRLFFGKSQVVVNKKRAWVFHHWNKQNNDDELFWLNVWSIPHLNNKSNKKGVLSLSKKRNCF